MPIVIPVKFKYAARDLWFDVADSEAQEADHVICSTERGQEIGLATADAREMSDEDLDSITNHAKLRPVLRVATDEDLVHAEELAARGEQAFPIFRRLVTESGLDMKPVGVEYLFDGEKAVCYFAAEERVDFRQLVRDLSHELHERIDMRQIGVREEAAIVGGYGHCGQELCCTRFGLAFEPVSIRMAKEQDLPLNSTKISGACGRLMCCLRYEFEAYRDFKSRAPKRNAVIETPLGKGKIVEYDTPKEQICIRLENGKQMRIPLADMTASEAAVKKSEELGCTCRPDTVSREVLEHLESPDVQMALAELDRRNGVVADDGPSEDDLFVAPKRRRRATQGLTSEEGEEKEQVVKVPAQSKRRRHKSRSARAADPTVRPAEPTAAKDKGATKGAAREASTEAGGQRAPRRRHHRSVASTGDVARTPADATGEVKRPSRSHRTRHPGDHGGAAAQATDAAAPAKRKPAHLAAQEDAPAPEKAAAPKRRRRHRGGRGRGKGPDAQGGGSTDAPSGE